MKQAGSHFLARGTGTMLREEGVGGFGMTPDRLLSAAGGAYWPLATYPCPSLNPSFIGGGAHEHLPT